MSNNRLNWDNLGANWTLSYNPNIIERPFHGRPWVSTPQTEVTITGVIQPMILTCVEDYEQLVNWFTTRSKLVRCPVFYRAPVTYEGKTSFYDADTLSIRWNDSPYRFSGGYYTGSNANPTSYKVIDPNQPVEWKVDIRPLENGIPFVQPGLKLPIQIGAIPFYVKPRRPSLAAEVFLNLDPVVVGQAAAIYEHLLPPAVSHEKTALFTTILPPRV
jgi:hypothetical protein